MGKKYTFDQVQKIFANNNCELLENTYINSKQHLRYRCECNRISKISLNSFLHKGSRCKQCGYKKNKEKQKLSYEYVKQFFTDKKCQLLSKRYINNHQLLEYICKCGNNAQISFNNFQTGYRCKKCAQQRIAEKLKLPYSFINKTFEKFGCKLLSKKYINSETHLEYICNCGVKNKITFHHFLSGQRCKKCGIKKMSGSNNPHWNPNLTDEDRRNNRKHLEYELWRKKVYTKNYWTCQICNKKKNTKICAHHLQSYDKNKNLRLDVSNGITLCVNCHKQFHTIYRYGGNTKAQFETFLLSKKASLQPAFS